MVNLSFEYRDVCEVSRVDSGGKALTELLYTDLKADHIDVTMPKRCANFYDLKDSGCVYNF